MQRGKQKAPSKARQILPVAIGFGLVSVLSILLLLTILVLYSSGISFDRDDEDGDHEKENMQTMKAVFCLIWLICLLGALCFIGARVFFQSLERFKIGFLGGATLIFANIALVSFFYFFMFPWNQDQDDGDENGDQQMERREQGRFPYVFSLVCLALTIIYAILAFVILDAGFGAFRGAETVRQADAITSRAYAEVLSDVWHAISGIAIAAMLLMFFVIVLIRQFRGEEDERAREEGRGVGKLLLIIGWISLLLLGFLVVGNQVLGTGSSNQLTIGAFSGGLWFFAGLAFLLAILNGASFLTEEGPERDRNQGFAIVTFVSLFLAIAFASFAWGTHRYRDAIIAANASDPPTPKGSPARGYVQMGDSEVQRGSSSNRESQAYKTSKSTPNRIKNSGDYTPPKRSYQGDPRYEGDPRYQGRPSMSRAQTPPPEPPSSTNDAPSSPKWQFWKNKKEKQSNLELV